MLYALWGDLSTWTKVTLIVTVIAVSAGLPTGRAGWAWRQERQMFQAGNCSEDLAKPMLSAASQSDEQAVLRAASFGAQKIGQSTACFAAAVRHPQGTVSFLVDEHRRSQ